MGSVLSPAEFRRNWALSTVALLPGGAPPIPAEACSFLREGGLPARVLFFQAGAPHSELSFGAIARPMLRLSDASLWNAATVPAPHWARHWVLGEESFINGSAMWSVEEASGHIFRFDVEVDDDVTLVNTSVARLATSLCLATDWSGELTGARGAPAGAADALYNRLAECDPEAMTAGFWKDRCECVRQAGPRRVRIKKSR